MSLLIGFLTFVLVMNCLFLILLILIQLPKKEAGAGIAFGGAATDALFGAGSGNALTNLTKYCATFFVGMAILLSVLNMHAARESSRRLEQELSRQAGAAAPAPITPQMQITPVPTVSNTPVQVAPAVALTNARSISAPNVAPAVQAEAPSKPAAAPSK
jgi:protein translocase SecG subunit